MDDAAVFRNTAAVQAFPVIAGIVLRSIANRRHELTYARYGAFFAWPMLLWLAASGTMAATPRAPRTADTIAD